LRKDGNSRILSAAGVVTAMVLAATLAVAQMPGEQPNLRPRITQEMLLSDLSYREARREGLRIFATPFNTLDGLGDGPMNPDDPVSPGGRPTLGGNGMFLRMNGLDSQTCHECHSVLSTRTIPTSFAVGGAGNISDSAFPGVIDPDIDASENPGFAAMQGRMINPPFSFGSGGVELLGKEMTGDLQALASRAVANPGITVPLESKGVRFGSIVYRNGSLDTSDAVGVDDDLVVRPFGRKGCCATVREFDAGAMQFHHGIQPVETVGENVDADGDGVSNELLVGELSALHIFQTSLERPRRQGREFEGEQIFHNIGCAGCHVPEMTTASRDLTLSFPEIAQDPGANIYYSINLARHPAGFEVSGEGIAVPLFADLKRHDMGPGLEESTSDELDRFFQTARLWGVADTAPYLHDGRAPTLTEAILWHGGESTTARDLFAGLAASEKIHLLDFLRTLRVPDNPSVDLRAPSRLQKEGR
jgi:hypothetical protein